MLTYTVTFTCNARCVMCDSWRKDAKGDLTLAEIERIFTAASADGRCPADRWSRSCAAIWWTSLGLAAGALDPALLHVTTNGFLTDRIVDFCERRPRTIPLNLLVSIDGVGSRTMRSADTRVRFAPRCGPSRRWRDGVRNFT